MPLNIPGLLVPFQLLVYPRLALPSLVVKGKRPLYCKLLAPLTILAQEDIRQIDFLALKRAGYRGAVFDKDNCLVSGFVYSNILLC